MKKVITVFVVHVREMHCSHGMCSMLHVLSQLGAVQKKKKKKNYNNNKRKWRCKIRRKVWVRRYSLTIFAIAVLHTNLELCAPPQLTKCQGKATVYSCLYMYVADVQLCYYNLGQNKVRNNTTRPPNKL